MRAAKQERCWSGKTGFGPSCTQEDINSLMVSLAKQGKRVVRLKGGDPLIFGRAAEEIAACEAANIAVDVVPGITSVQGAAARLGIALTDRKKARRLQYVTGHAKRGGLPADLDWKSLADPSTTTAIFMPTRTLAALAEKAIAEGLDPQHAGTGDFARHPARSGRRYGVHRRTSGAACAGRIARPGACDDRKHRLFGERRGIKAFDRDGIAPEQDSWATSKRSMSLNDICGCALAPGARSYRQPISAATRKFGERRAGYNYSTGLPCTDLHRT